jgi:hypothetical protein
LAALAELAWAADGFDWGEFADRLARVISDGDFHYVVATEVHPADDADYGVPEHSDSGRALLLGPDDPVQPPVVPGAPQVWH